MRFVLLEDILGRVARKYDPRAQDPLSQLTSTLISREHVSTGARALVESMQCSRWSWRPIPMQLSRMVAISLRPWKVGLPGSGGPFASPKLQASHDLLLESTYYRGSSAFCATYRVYAEGCRQYFRASPHVAILSIALPEVASQVLSTKKGPAGQGLRTMHTWKYPGCTQSTPSHCAPLRAPRSTSDTHRFAVCSACFVQMQHLKLQYTPSPPWCGLCSAVVDSLLNC